MELNSNTKCPKCGQMSFVKGHAVCGLPCFDISPHDGALIRNREHVFPVIPLFCTICNYVEFEYRAPSNRNEE